ncbi:hypothetical protein KNU62_gp91 [Gordonia phage Bakery]|uniref:Uncharacterized protein n=1 Tax=Gordonia phage Bakery TaxID=2591205 RepID=A0A514DGY8_9CAUD|nr:hypothetical protein KNU62_gp91 [Gordonia phage Bakery]QDH92875.1 hypothetical protein SEA_BAKERY_91 [Gordonia phage Bakery]
MTALELLRIVWFAGMPIVWWFAMPIIFRWYRSGDSFDLALSRFMAGFGGAVVALFWPIAIAVYLLGRLVVWRTRDEGEE